MDRKGFTLVELISVFAILGLIMILAIPNILTTYDNILINNYINKLLTIQIAAEKYANKEIKDEIKSYAMGQDNGDPVPTCKTITPAELISLGYLKSDDDIENEVYNPIDGMSINGNILLCYSFKDYKVHAYYTRPFNYSNVYYAGEYVTANEGDGNQIYQCMITTQVGTKITDVRDLKSYFEKVDFAQEGE